MGLRLELGDLPPRYRAQAERQLARGGKKRGDPLLEAARAARSTGKEFDSKGEYGALKLRPVRYTADFRLVYADGTVEIVEVKSKFVRRMQRDYAVRRRVFLEMVARPAGWKFTEIITADSAEEVKRWRELAKEGKTL